MTKTQTRVTAQNPLAQNLRKHALLQPHSDNHYHKHALLQPMAQNPLLQTRLHNQTVGAKPVTKHALLQPNRWRKTRYRKHCNHVPKTVIVRIIGARYGAKPVTANTRYCNVPKTVIFKTTLAQNPLLPQPRSENRHRSANQKSVIAK
jgi:hypothetical protein